MAGGFIVGVAMSVLLPKPFPSKANAFPAIGLYTDCILNLMLEGRSVSFFPGHTADE